MKHILPVFILLCCLQGQAQMKIAEADFTIDMPKGLDTSRYRNILAIMAPRDGATDDFSENLNVVSQIAADFPDTIQTTEQYTKFTITQLKSIGVNVEQVVDEKIGKDGIAAKTIIYETDLYMPDKSALKLRQALLRFGPRFYVVTYTCRPAEYARFLPIMQQAISTIVFKP